MTDVNNIEKSWVFSTKDHKKLISFRGCWNEEFIVELLEPSYNKQG
jgi:hypothetical protein